MFGFKITLNFIKKAPSHATASMSGAYSSISRASLAPGDSGHPCYCVGSTKKVADRQN